MPAFLWSLQMTWPYMYALCISAIMEEIAAATQQTSNMLMRFFIDRKVCFIKGQLGQQWKILIHRHVVSKFVWKNIKSQLFISYLFDNILLHICICLLSCLPFFGSVPVHVSPFV